MNVTEAIQVDTSLNLIELLLRQTGSILLLSLVQTWPSRREDLRSTDSTKNFNVENDISIGIGIDWQWKELKQLESENASKSNLRSEEV